MSSNPFASPLDDIAPYPTVVTINHLLSEKPFSRPDVPMAVVTRQPTSTAVSPALTTKVDGMAGILHL
ncbi:hypothetical protein [Martelella alba]|uniref:Uncharacterized protein n=1 Tax=Martelella alba TaxID=2590451 RepID=A0ABY2SN19_9HYPH|nr:hypothetical protein [Martelella alba]TKI07256.1 hypothetical protein FCN80_07485 [Martelella alba]